MIDYLDADNAFLVETSDELTAWPHDPRRAYRTLRYITHWTSLCRAFRASYDVAQNNPERYAQMSGHAVASLETFCSQAIAEQRLGGFFTHLFERPAPCAAQVPTT